MQEPKLSIVIPAYNEERFIGALLEKIQAVDLSRLGVTKEIIVIDDCSTDKTSEVAAGFAGVILTFVGILLKSPQPIAHL